MLYSCPDSAKRKTVRPPDVPSLAWALRSSADKGAGPRNGAVDELGRRSCGSRRSLASRGRGGAAQSSALARGMTRYKVSVSPQRPGALEHASDR